MSLQKPLFLFLVSLFSLAVIGAKTAQAGPTATPTATPIATATPIPTPTATPTGTPGPTATLGPTATPGPTAPTPPPDRQRGGGGRIIVEIDISPSRAINRAQLGSHQRILVVILGSERIDVTRVDLESLYFWPDGAPSIPGVKPAPLGDWNRDGFTDLLVRFDMDETGIAAGDTYACLTGKIYGVLLWGCDTIETFAPPGRQP